MPAPIQNSSTPTFAGEFCHKVEGKNRVTIPAAWRFAEEVELFMIPRSLKSCISVMTRQEVERLIAKADAMEAEERSDFLDVLGSSLVQVTLDKGGRITIPEAFFEQLGLPAARNVWMTGSLETFNLWSVADFEAHKAHSGDRPAALKRKFGI